MKRVLRFYYLCKFIIIFLVSFFPNEVLPKKYEKVYKNYNYEKLINTREYPNVNKFLIKNNRSKFISNFRKTRGKSLARINQLFLIIILIVIFIVAFEIWLFISLVFIPSFLELTKLPLRYLQRDEQ